MKCSSIQSARGSAIFFILIAIALFAALSFAVGNMMRSGNADMISEEKAGLVAAEILDYALKMKAAVQDMRISNGCDETDISFENTVAGGYTNGSNTACQVFHSDGGNMSYIDIPEDWLAQDPAITASGDYGLFRFEGRSCVPGVGSGAGACWSDGEDNEELVFFVPFVKGEVCRAINDRMGITEISGDVPTDFGCSWAYRFTGSYEDGLGINNESGTPTASNEEFWGKTTGCYKSTSSCNWLEPSYHFYQVLIAR